jgi:hypothetical protein
MRPFLLAITLLATHPATAVSGYVRVLLPIYIGQPVHGAYGSLWQSQFAIHNASLDRRYTFAICSTNGGCPDLTTDEELDPQQTKSALPPRFPVPANPVAGAVVWLLASGAPADNGDDLAYDLRVVDLSRSAIAAGTEVPVIREKAFLTSNAHLLNVPTDTRFRLALRIFEMNLDRADFDVRVFDQSTNAVLSVRRVRTVTPVSANGYTPGFVEVDDLLSGVSSPPAQVRVVIAPITTGIAFWSYVSVTNNDSQQITLVTPQ